MGGHMLKYVLIATVIAGPAAAETTTISTGDTVIIEQNTSLCKSMEDRQRLVSLASAGDKIAFNKFFASKGSIGDCVSFRTDTHALVEQTRIFSEAYCVRPKGGADCYWTFKPFLRKSNVR
jgi:hypothetical protein